MKSFFSSAACVVLLSMLTISCEKENENLTPAHTAATVEEATIDAYFQDMDALAAVSVDAPSDDEYSGGRTSGTITIDDHRFNCDGVVVTIDPHASSTIEHPLGVIIVDFGTEGCSDLWGNIRKGKLFFYYDGWRHQSGSTVITMPDNYFVNGIELKGTRTSTNITASQGDPLKFNVILEGGEAVFPDNVAVTRESDITWSWIREANPALDKLIIHTNSTANGHTRSGLAYAVSLPEQLEYNRSCGIAVSGIKKYVLDGETEITVDYGDGDCDSKVNVSLNGVTREVTIGG
jgi:hypothetical protein